MTVLLDLLNNDPRAKTHSERPRHPEKANRPDTPLQSKPAWIRVKAPSSADWAETKRIVRENKLVTVCEEAGCPNIGECWAKKHATLTGSSASSGPGRPVRTLQNAQARVQVSPMIMKVACFFAQHSPILGQRASSHTVTSLFSRTMRFVSAQSAELGAFTRIQEGLLCSGVSGRLAFSGWRGVFTRGSLLRRSSRTVIWSAS